MKCEICGKEITNKFNVQINDEMLQFAFCDECVSDILLAGQWMQKITEALDHRIEIEDD